MAVVTGESVEGSLSSRLRCFVVQFANDSVNGQKLEYFQNKPYIWRGLIVQFIKFLEANWEDCLCQIKGQFPISREKISQIAQSRRSVDNVAAFFVAIQIVGSFFGSFGVEKHILLEFQHNAEQAILECSAKSAEIAVSVEPALVVIEIIQKLLNRDKLLLAESRQEFIHGDFIGFVEGNQAFLVPDELYVRVMSYLSTIRREIPLTPITLGDLLYEKNVIRKFPNGAKYTYRKKISFGKQKTMGMFVLDLQRLLSFDIEQ